jgi:MFS family permease
VTTRYGLRLALLAFAQLIISVDYNIVYVALPAIGHQVGFSAQSLQWVVSAYAVGFGGLLLLGGRAVDRLGARRVFLVALLTYAVTSLVGGLATEPGPLVAARVAQGLGAGLLFPATLTLIGTAFAEGPQRNRAMALWGVAGASGALVGPLVGGLLTNYLGWRWVFFVNVPLALGAVLLGRRVLPADPPVVSGIRGFDIPGAVLATAGATLVVYGLASGPDAGWGSVRGAGAIALGVALLGALLLVERRTRDPLVPLRLLRHRGLVAAMAVSFVLMGAVNVLHYVFYLDLQNVLGLRALAAGLGFLPISLLAMVSSWKVLPAMLNRWGVRTTLVTGALGVGLAIGVMAVGMSATGSYWALLPGAILFGLFAGATYPVLFLAAGSGIPEGERGVASALTSTALQIGGAVGLAALVAVANAGLGPNPGRADVVDGLRTAGWAAAALAVASAVVALALKRSERQPHPPETTGVPAPVSASVPSS